jgi:hypothetical protein
MVEFLLGFTTAVILQYILNKIYMSVFEKRAQQIIDDTMTKLRETIVPARIEIEHGSLYMYHRETNEFLAQGKNFEELENAARSKYPNKLFNVPKDELNFMERTNEKNR